MRNVINVAFLTKAINPVEFVGPFVGGVGLGMLTGLVLERSIDKVEQKSVFLPPYSEEQKQCTFLLLLVHKHLTTHSSSTDCLMDTYAVVLLYQNLRRRLDGMSPGAREEIDEASFTCDFWQGEAVQVGGREVWTPSCKLYERVVGLRLRIAGNSQKLTQMGKNIAKAAREIVDDRQTLGMAQDPCVVELLGILSKWA
jgi:hypothetical protein